MERKLTKTEEESGVDLLTECAVYIRRKKWMKYLSEKNLSPEEGIKQWCREIVAMEKPDVSSYMNEEPNKTPMLEIVQQKPIRRLSQSELIEEIQELGDDKRYYQRLSHPKQQELVDTCGSQWRNETMSDAARGFAEMVLVKLRRMKNEEEGTSACSK